MNEKADVCRFLGMDTSRFKDPLTAGPKTTYLSPCTIASSGGAHLKTCFHLIEACNVCARFPDKAINHKYNSAIISVATLCRKPPFAALDSNETQWERIKDKSLGSQTRIHSLTSLSVQAESVKHLQGCRCKRFASITGGPAFSSFQAVSFGNPPPTAADGKHAVSPLMTLLEVPWLRLLALYVLTHTESRGVVFNLAPGGNFRGALYSGAKCLRYMSRWAPVASYSRLLLLFFFFATKPRERIPNEKGERDSSDWKALWLLLRSISCQRMSPMELR